MRYSVGPNVHINGDREMLNRLRVRNRWPLEVIMNDPAYALWVQENAPYVQVVHRQHPDDTLDALGDPVQWVNREANRLPDPRIWLYAGNEVSGGPGITEWTLRAMDRAEELGRTLVVLNAGTGGPEDEEWHAETPHPTASGPLEAWRYGVLRPILERLAEQRHVLGLHEYIDHWDWQADLYWQVGRFNRIFTICDELGLARPLIAITEHGFDSLTSEYKGWRQAVRLGAVTEREYAEQINACGERVYDPVNIPRVMFSFGDSGGWQDHNHDGAELFWEVTNMAGASTDLNWEPADIDVQVQSLNVRQAPSIGAPVLGTLDEGIYSGAAVNDPVASDGYVWFRVAFGNLNGFVAVRNTAGTFILAQLTIISDAPDPDPDPDPPAGGAYVTVPMLDERLATLQEDIDSQFQYVLSQLADTVTVDTIDAKLDTRFAAREAEVGKTVRLMLTSVADGLRAAMNAILAAADFFSESNE